jgi:putative hydrolase of the HAD superfamily
MRFKAVLFDLFGTLVPAFGKEYFENCLGAMADIVGADHADFVRLWTKDTYHDRVTGTFPSTEANARCVCDTLGIAAADAQLAEVARIRFKFSQDVVVPRPDAIPTLRAIREAGLKLGLVSDCSEEVPRLWPETPFAEFFQTTVFSCVAKTRKPDPIMFRQACEVLGIAPEACLYVGDGYGRELTGAASLGMTPVLIAVPGEARGDTPGYEGDDWDGLRVESLSEVCEIMRK